MKFSRAKIEQIIREELTRHLRGLVEGPDAPDDTKKDKKDSKASSKKKKSPSKGDPDVSDAASTSPPRRRDPGAPGAPPEPKTPDDDDPNVPPGSPEPQELDPDEPADAPPEPEEPPPPESAEDTVADQVTGKRIQSITVDPKSKLVPGASEIVLTFDEITDPLKILIAKNGVFKFYFRGALHNELE